MKGEAVTNLLARKVEVLKETKRLRAEIQRANEKFMRLHDELKEIEQAVDNIEAIDHVYDWAWLLATGPGGEQSSIRQKMGDAHMVPGLRLSGYMRDAMQRSLQIALTWDGREIEGIVKLLQKILPAVEPVGGLKYIDVMEHSLSQYGGYWIGVCTESAALVKRTYGTDREIFRGTLENVLRHTATHYPMRLPNDE